MPTFRAEVQLFGTTATGFSVPPDAVAALEHGNRPPVNVSVTGFEYRSTIAPYGDAFFLPLNRANRDAAGIAAGDIVEVTLELGLEPRVVEVPPRPAASPRRLRSSRQPLRWPRLQPPA